MNETSFTGTAHPYEYFTYFIKGEYIDLTNLPMVQDMLSKMFGYFSLSFMKRALETERNAIYCLSISFLDPKFLNV